MDNEKKIGRRSYLKILGTGSIGAFMFPNLAKDAIAQDKVEKPKTNIDEALKFPRTNQSMPGKFPGKVVKVLNKNSVKDNAPVLEEAEKMLTKGMLELTGEKNITDAWKHFVKPGEKIGLKLNPVAGKVLTTSHEVVKSIIKQLEEAGIKREDIVLWDRREFQLHECEFTEENYPGIKIIGTERKDKEGSYYDKDGILYGKKMIDENWYYKAECSEKYDEYTIPYMVNEGEYSYFSKICTQEVDKIINVPILKNAGSTVTLCLKNLAYGSITNTSRLHKQLWSETTAEVCAFPPLRDKVVLNIVDGLKGCFEGGPGANPQYITNFNTLLVGTDPVAVDRVGYDIVIKKRMDEGIQKKESKKGKKFLELAENLKLGVADIKKIDLKEYDLT